LEDVKRALIQYGYYVHYDKVYCINDINGTHWFYRVDHKVWDINKMIKLDERKLCDSWSAIEKWLKIGKYKEVEIQNKQRIFPYLASHDLIERESCLSREDHESFMLGKVNRRSSEYYEDLTMYGIERNPGPPSETDYSKCECCGLTFCNNVSGLMNRVFSIQETIKVVSVINLKIKPSDSNVFIPLSLSCMRNEDEILSSDAQTLTSLYETYKVEGVETVIEIDNEDENAVDISLTILPGERNGMQEMPRIANKKVLVKGENRLVMECDIPSFGEAFPNAFGDKKSRFYQVSGYVYTREIMMDLMVSSTHCRRKEVSIKLNIIRNVAFSVFQGVPIPMRDIRAFKSGFKLMIHGTRFKNVLQARHDYKYKPEKEVDDNIMRSLMQVQTEMSRVICEITLTSILTSEVIFFRNR